MQIFLFVRFINNTMQIAGPNIYLSGIKNISSVNFGSMTEPARRIQKSAADSFEKRNFITPHLSKKTFEEARTLVIKSLFDKEPKESIALIKNDEILFHSIGNEFETEIPDKIMDEVLNSGNGNIVIVHSHTPESTGLTAPLSLTDIENMISNNAIKSICAINNKGEYSIIEAKPDINYNYGICAAMDEKCQAGFVDLFRGEKKKEYIKFLKSLDDIQQTKEGETFDDFLLRMEDAYNKLDEYYDYATSLREFPKYMENFWKQYAEKFGFKYYSNFSF